MTTTTATTAVRPESSRSTLLTLAGLEARRFARHPLFLVGVALLALTAVIHAAESPPEVGLHGLTIEPAMALGIFGLVVAARLTRTSARTLDAFGGTPVPERTRTAALLLACLVPAAVGLAWTVFFLTYFSANRPVPQSWWFDTLPASEIITYFVAASVVAAYGGPALGVVIGRWVRWSGAPLVAAVLLVVATMVAGSGIIEEIREYRQVMPWTGWYGADNGAGADIFYPGNPHWWLVYTVCLCVLAVVAALWHDRDLGRRRLRTVAVVAALVAVTATTLSITTGVQETRLSPPVLYPEQVR